MVYGMGDSQFSKLRRYKIEDKSIFIMDGKQKMKVFQSLSNFCREDE